jgi:hypothetical protein
MQQMRHEMLLAIVGSIGKADVSSAEDTVDSVLHRDSFSALAPGRGQGSERAKFRRDAEKVIRDTTNHPLKFLLDDYGKFKRTRGLSHAELADSPDLVQIGHMISKKSGQLELFMLQGAWENQYNNITVEHPSLGGLFIADNESVEIGGVAVDLKTARMWERWGFLEAGTVANAPRVE